MEQLIYIEQRDKEEASKLSKGFAINETKNRAYINVLGSELAMKYLAQENISVSNTYNLHNIHKIREEFDVADVMLPNIHIDVRVVYDENLIFVPKAHFDYNITPNIYLVFNMAEDLSFVKFLGFFEPKLINKNNQNREYYFIEKEKLSHPSDLKNYIENFNGNTTTELSEDEIEEGQRLAISFIDNEISDNDKQKLLKMLLKSSQLRENLIEFDNFEVISYHTATTEDMDTTVLPAPTTVDEFEKFENTDDFADFSLEDLVEEDDGLNEETSKESEQEEDFTDNAEENAESVEDTDVKTIDEIPSEDLENFDGTEALDYTTDDINNLEKADNDDDINLVGEASLEDFPSETTEENISTTEDIKEDNTEESSGIAGEIAAGAVGLATAGTAAVAGADALGAGVDAISAEIAEETLSTAADVIEDVGEDHTKTEIIDDMSTDNITLPDLPMSPGLEDLESLDESDIVESDEAT